MLTLLLASNLALAAGSELPVPDADIVANRTLQAPEDAIRERLGDLRNHERYWPVGCAKKWVYGAVTTGKGATATLVYTPGSLRRKLTGTLSQVDPDKRIEFDHEGRKGFVTKWAFADKDGATDVEMHTWILPPPRPFRKAYFNRVRPAWQFCHDGFLENLAADVPSTDGGTP